MSGRELVFWADAIVAVMSGLVVILHRNPVVSALSLVVNLCAMAVFFLLLDASFLFAVQIILYAGAIMVLFLFVVMLLDPQGEGVAGRSGRVQLVAGVAFAVLLVSAVTRMLPRLQPSSARPLAEGFGQAAGVGRMLFGDYLLPFEVASILLLVAMIGALHMGRRDAEQEET